MLRYNLKIATFAAASMLAGACAIAVAADLAPGQFLVAADACRTRCQAVENQCRLSSKDLDSSKCTAKFLACVASCRK